MAEYTSLVVEEIEGTLERGGFEHPQLDAVRVEVTDSFNRKLGDCRPLQQSARPPGPEQYEIRIAQRLFEDGHEEQWRDTVRHEVAHATVFATFDRTVQPHGEEWKAAARRAGADPTARYSGEDIVDPDYVLACPNDCFERGYLKRSTRVKHPWQYTCPDCETRLVSYDAGGSPASLDPGTCNVTSLPWETAPECPETSTDRTARYLLACPDGCMEWPYQQRSKRIKQPWQYSCPDCGTTLVSCDAEDHPDAFDPGTCNVDSISWTSP
jgi:predicted SprT family Zn-dependent metalloprotease